MTAIVQPARSTHSARSRRLFTPSRIAVAFLVVLYLGLAIYSQSILPLRLTKGVSMEPSLRQGDVILVKKVPFSEIEIGDVVAFRTPDVFAGAAPGTILHRVIDISIRDDRLVLSTKGDNSGVDPFPVSPADVRGKAVLRIKYVGLPLVFITSRQGILFISIATLLSLLYIPAFIMFYATVLRGGDSSKETAIAIRPDEPPASESQESAGDYSDLRETLASLGERVERIHSRGVLAVPQGRGRSVGASETRLETSRASNESAQVVNGGRQATRNSQVKRPTSSIARATRKHQIFVSLPDGDSERPDPNSGGATHPHVGNHGSLRGANGDSAEIALGQPEVKLFEQYQSALSRPKIPYGTGPREVTSNELQALVLKVVEVEAPIHILDFRWAIREYLGVESDTEAFRNQMDTAIQNLVSKRKIRRELANGSHSGNGQFLAIPGFGENVKPRRGGTRNDCRDISRISDAELRQGLLAVMWAMYAASPGALMTETARQFGFARTDVKVTTRINSSIDHLLKEGKISLDDGGILHGR